MDLCHHHTWNLNHTWQVCPGQVRRRKLQSPLPTKKLQNSVANHNSRENVWGTLMRGRVREWWNIMNPDAKAGGKQISRSPFVIAAATKKHGWNCAFQAWSLAGNGIARVLMKCSFLALPCTPLLSQNFWRRNPLICILKRCAVILLHSQVGKQLK